MTKAEQARRTRWRRVTATGAPRRPCPQHPYPCAARFVVDTARVPARAYRSMGEDVQWRTIRVAGGGAPWPLDEPEWLCY
jgi:hypothetical protein